MTSQVAIDGACAFAWRNYLLIHSGVSEDDGRRAALHRYLNDLCDNGEYDFALLQVAAVTYLKSLDELQDDRGARLAADQVLTDGQMLDSRRSTPGLVTSTTTSKRATTTRRR